MVGYTISLLTLFSLDYFKENLVMTLDKEISIFKNYNMTTENRRTFFAPELFINNGVKDISFYANAFGASEQMRFSNDDGSIHVVELSIDGAIFHIHEITSKQF